MEVGKISQCEMLVFKLGERPWTVVSNVRHHGDKINLNLDLILE